MAPHDAEDEDVVTLQHGAGGSAMRRLVSQVLADGFEDGAAEIGLDAMDDGAALEVAGEHVVVTTDSHVIQPPFFPGGDIGRLAVSGTVNDLAAMGATDVRALTSSIIVEAGYPQGKLRRISASMRETCQEANAPVVTGDTKVMGHGELDGVVVNTTGIGIASHLTPDAGLKPDDVLLLTGEIGNHGIALLAEREGIDVDMDLVSDVTPINDLVHEALSVAGSSVHAVKDPTRTGLAGALSEMAEKSGVGVVVMEPRVPLDSDVKGAGELLGIDPFHIANEGKAVLAVAPERAEEVLEALRKHPKGANAAAIGKVVEEHEGRVVLDTGIGRRYLTPPEREPVPRIC